MFNVIYNENESSYATALVVAKKKHRIKILFSEVNLRRLLVNSLLVFLSIERARQRFCCCSRIIGSIPKSKVVFLSTLNLIGEWAKKKKKKKS